MKTLAQQIAELDDVQPKEFDPEEEYPDQNSDGEHASDDEASRARGHYVSVGPSALRKQNLDLDVSDPKYDGVKTTRKQLLEESDHDSIPVDEDESIHSDADSIDDDDNDAGSDSASGSSEEQGDESVPKARSPSPESDAEAAQDDMTSALQQSRLADRQKGKAITRQLRMWDTIVDARIKLQKAVTSSNVLPPPHAAGFYRVSSSRTTTLVDEVLREGLELSEDLFALREALATAQDISLPPRKRRRLSPPPPTASDPHSHPEPTPHLTSLLADSTNAFSDLSAIQHPHTVTILSKWSAKVQAVAPAALLPSKRTAFTGNNKGQGQKGAVELIAEVLDEGPGRAKAVGRTRVRRGQVQARLGLGLGSSSGAAALGVLMEQDDSPAHATAAAPATGQEGDAEVFDDTDFYQEMLRDIIHAKAGAGAGAGTHGADAWEAARPAKIKKVVDTRASKGRKLRYEVHEKLQHFMVPVAPRSAGNTTWHEEQIDELFASLMGKGFGPSAQSQSVSDERNSAADEASGIPLNGLRVF